MHVLFYDPAPKLPLGRARGLRDAGRPAGARRRRLAARARHQGHALDDGRGADSRDAAGRFLINASRGRVVDVERWPRPSATAICWARPSTSSPTSRRAHARSSSRRCAACPTSSSPRISAARPPRRRRGSAARSRASSPTTPTSARPSARSTSPRSQLPARPSGTRFMHVHRNTPGMLVHVIDVFSRRGLNIARAVPADRRRARLRRGRHRRWSRGGEGDPERTPRDRRHHPRALSLRSAAEFDVPWRASGRRSDDLRPDSPLCGPHGPHRTSI